MTARPKAILKSFDLLRGKLSILHVSKVGFIVRSPLVELDEIVLRDLQSDGDEVEQWVENLVVQILGLVLEV